MEQFCRIWMKCRKRTKLIKAIKVWTEEYPTQWKPTICKIQAVTILNFWAYWNRSKRWCSNWMFHSSQLQTWISPPPIVVVMHLEQSQTSRIIQYRPDAIRYLIKIFPCQVPNNWQLLRHIISSKGKWDKLRIWPLPDSCKNFLSIWISTLRPATLPTKKW